MNKAQTPWQAVHTLALCLLVVCVGALGLPPVVARANETTSAPALCNDSAAVATVVIIKPQETPPGVAAEHFQDRGVIAARQLCGVSAADNAALAALAAEQPRLLTDNPGVPLGRDFQAQLGADGQAVMYLPAGVYQIYSRSTHKGDEPTLPITPFLFRVDADQTHEIKAKNLPLALWINPDKQRVSNGEALSFSLGAGVPPVDIDGLLHRYALGAVMDPRLGEFVLESVQVRTTDGLKALPQALADGTVLYDFIIDGQLAQVVFRPAGLAELARLRGGASGPGDAKTTVEVVIGTRVNGDATAMDTAPLRVHAQLLADGVDQEIPSEEVTVELTTPTSPPAPGGGSSSGWIGIIGQLLQHPLTWIFIITGITGGLLGLIAWLLGDRTPDGSGQRPPGATEPEAQPGRLEPSTTPQANQPSQDNQPPGAPQPPTSSGALAVTGASVITLVLIALALLVLAAVLLRNRQSEQQEEDGK